MKKNIIYILIVILILSNKLYSTEKFQFKPVNQLNKADSYPWEKVELLVDNSQMFKQENYHEETKVKHTKYLKLLKDNDAPHSKYFIMHYAPNWNKSNKTPVLLIHGAGDQSFRAWSHPYFNELDEGKKIDFPGFMQKLVKKGYPVFAITFPHNHGDNFFQAEHVANAIAKIKKELKKESDENFKVDIIAHSKGGVSTRIYISSMGENVQNYSWLTPFRKDVNKFISIATPLKGVDTMFRYYMYNTTVVQQDQAAPLGTDRMLYMFMNMNFKEHNTCFEGQFQILHNFVDDEEDKIPFTYESGTMFDFNYTRNRLYYGGSSAYLSSIGIDKAVEKGHNLINLMNKKGADKSVKIAVLAGNNQVINKVKFLWMEIPIGEKADDSDGLLFLKSATYTNGICKRGAKLIHKKVLPLHHLAISCATIAFEEVNKILEK